MELPVPKSLSRLARRTLRPDQRAAIAAGLRALDQNRYRLDRKWAANQRALAASRNRHRGGTCVIIGNGPSMRGFDLRRLDGVKCFCLNRGYLLWREQGRQPDYLVAVNDLVLEQFSRDLAVSGRERFVPWDFHRRFDEAPDTRFLRTLWHPRFHGDIAEGTWLGATVTFTALQIAYHMGFSKVVLLGVDHSFSYEGAPNQELLSKAADPNHFDPAYFGPGVRWHAPDLDLSERSYAMARAVFEADGREIVDATAGGRLRVFRREEDLEALIR